MSRLGAVARVTACALLVLVSVGAPPRAADAAEKRYRAPRLGQKQVVAPKQYSGGGLLYGVPYRTFEDHVGRGLGFDAVGSNGVGETGVARIRSDITLLYHRNEDQPVPDAQLQSGDQLTLGTAANLFHILLGPEFAVKSGGFRPYAFAVAGYGTSNIRQKLDGAVDGGSAAYHLETSQRTSMFTWGFGAGVRIPTSPNVLLDLTAEYRDAMGARMLTTSRVFSSGGLVTYGQGDVDAEQILFRVGFARAVGP